MQKFNAPSQIYKKNILFPLHRRAKKRIYNVCMSMVRKKSMN